MEQNDKSVAFETESYGVASEIFYARRNISYNPLYLTIRGLSDYINAPTSEEQRISWTPYAASSAIALLRLIIERLVKVYLRS